MNGLAVPLEQRMSALERANEIRVYRARLKKDVASGRASYDTFLALGPHDERLQSMKLTAALRVMPGLGPAKISKILQRAAISPSKTLGGLSGPQWERLYLVLESYPTVGRRLSEARGNVER